MCGIVGAVAQRNVTPILIEGLKRMEYRGYDSSGVAVVNANGNMQIRKSSGKVHSLEEKLLETPVEGAVGIAHTRWATHGQPSETNAHPHCSTDYKVAVVHNGIIENYLQLRQQLTADGVEFRSETDTEVIAHLVHHYLAQG